ncbi:ClpP/crotonase [Viridothelium virens]|uniref:ClpP/crotonase n=1 Tax=Viridothelium virens TaxID=1048519 RepID=A0A6A6HKW2_VIRVR|nr:ClpP/crotonase [Viridothelium virens]
MSRSKMTEWTYDYFNMSFPINAVVHVEINRPAKLNAWIEPMWLELAKIFNRISHDPEIRAVLLTGAGERAFSAGLDIQAASQGGILSESAQDNARKANALRRHILEFQSCISALEKCEKPIISLLHGSSYGLAIDLTLATDIRLCTSRSPPTTFCVKEVDIGIAADIGTLSRLPKAVGNLSWVKDIALTARPFGWEEALRVGLVSAAYPSKKEGIEAGLKLASAIAEKSPVAVMGTKKLINYSRDHSVEDGLEFTAVWNSAMVQTSDVKNAMTAGMQKRKPIFEKL